MSVAIVTGATGHIGRVLVDSLANDDRFNSIIAADRADVGAAGKVSSLRVDLSTPAGAQALADRAQALAGGAQALAGGRQDKGGDVSLLVNAAGVCELSPVSAPYDKAAVALQRIADNNLLSLLLPSRALMPQLIAGGDALIVNVTSRDLLPAADQSTQSPDHDLWLASQWAVNGATDAWALDLARYGVRVNGLCVGGIDGATTAFPEPDWQHDAVPAETLGGLLSELLDSDLSGENIGFWPGRTGPLRSARPRHQQITG